MILKEVFPVLKNIDFVDFHRFAVTVWEIYFQLCDRQIIRQPPEPSSTSSTFEIFYQLRYLEYKGDPSRVY